MNIEPEIFKAIFEQMPDGCAIVDPASRRIIGCNSAFEDLFGERGQIEPGKLSFLNDLHPGYTVEQFAQSLQDVLAGHVFHTQQRLIQNGKPGIYLEVSADELVLPDRSLVLIKVKKESGAAHSSDLQQQRLKDTNVLARVMSAVSETRDLNKVLSVVCRELAIALNIPHAALAISDEKGEFFEVAAEYSAGENPSVIGKKIPTYGNHSAEYVIKNKEPIYIADVQTDERMKFVRAVMEQRGIISMLIVPLVAGEQVVGILELDTLESRQFTLAENLLVENALNALGPLVELSQVYAEQQKELQRRKEVEGGLEIRERFLASLVEMQILLLRADSPDLVYQELVRLLGEVSGADRAYIFINHQDEDENLLTSQRAEWVADHVAAQIDNPDLQNMSYKGALVRWFDLLSCGIYLVGKVVDFPEVEQKLLLPQGIRSLLVLPIIVKGDFFGFIGFDNCTSDRPWSVMEIAMLKSATSSISLYEERRQASQALRESQASLLLMLDQLPAILWTTDLSLEITSVRGIDIASISAEQGDQWFKTMLSDRQGAPRALTAHKKALLGEATAYEMRIAKSSFQAYVEPFTDATGNVIGVLGIALDISERKRAEKDLALQRDFAIRIMNNMGQGLMVTNEEGQFEFVNPALAQLVQYKKEVLRGKTLIDIAFEEDHQVLLKAFERGDKSMHIKSLETRLRRLDGEAVYVLITLVPMVRGGILTGSIVVVTDLTQPKQIETALRRSEEFMRELYTISSAVPATFKEKIQALLHMGCRHFNMDTGILSHIQGDKYYVIEAYPASGNIQSGMVRDLKETYCQEVLIADKPISFHHASQHDVWAAHPCYKNTNIESFLGSKVAVAGKMYGTLSFISLLPHAMPFKPADEESLRLMAQWVSSEIEHEQYLHQLQVNADAIVEKNEALSKARDQALEVSRLKSEFLTTMSHEIRTPMNAVIGMTDLLLDTEMKPEQYEYANLIHDSAHMLLAIINDILDFSRIEAGKIILENAVFDTQAALKNVVDQFIPKAEENGLRLVSKIESDVPHLLVGDAARLKQILSNLIGNAIKFTAEGQVAVTVEIQQANWKQVVLKTQIQDTGIGIPEEIQKELFQPFMQADSSTTRKYGGTGLGLAISKRLAELMGGKIGFHSIPNEGSTFWFTSVFDRTGVGNALTDDALQELVDGAKVLLISNNATFSHFMEQQLRPWKVNIAVTRQWESARIMLQQASEMSEPFLSVFVDHAVDGESAIQAGRGLKNTAGKMKPVLVLLPENGAEVNLLLKFYEHVFPRPVQIHEVVQFIAGLMGQKPLPVTKELRNIDRRESALSKNQPLLGRILVVEDDVANQRMVSRQLKKLGFEVEIASNGQRVLDLIQENLNFYDLIFMDCQMPAMDGFETTRQLRALEEKNGQHHLVIAMAENEMTDAHDLCIASGMDDYVSKPVRIEDLENVLNKWVVQLAAQEVKVEKRPKQKSVKYEASELLDSLTIQGIRDLQMEGAPDLFGELVEIFLSESQDLLEKARRAVQENDGETFRLVVHNIKGSSSNLGAKLLSSKAAEIEQMAKDRDLKEAGSLLGVLEDIHEQSYTALKALLD